MAQGIATARSGKRRLAVLVSCVEIPWRERAAPWRDKTSDTPCARIGHPNTPRRGISGAPPFAQRKGWGFRPLPFAAVAQCKRVAVAGHARWPCCLAHILPARTLLVYYNDDTNWIMAEEITGKPGRCRRGAPLPLSSRTACKHSPTGSSVKRNGFELSNAESLRAPCAAIVEGRGVPSRGRKRLLPPGHSRRRTLACPATLRAVDIE